ncbi:hypothetical protein CR513_17251, partial [Mucuna pruriens]
KTGPPRVASGADSSSSGSLQSLSSSGEIFLFEIWYRDNSEDDVSEDPFSWVEKDVKRAFSQYIQGSLLLGMMKKLLQPGPWMVRLRHCRPDESVNNRASPDETPFFYIYEPVFSKLGLKLPFTSFERSILQALNVAPSQLHPNSWAFIRAFELLCEDLGREPSLGYFFGFFASRKCLSHLNWKLLKPFLESFKTFKDKFFKGSLARASWLINRGLLFFLFTGPPTGRVCYDSPKGLGVMGRRVHTRARNSSAPVLFQTHQRIRLTLTFASIRPSPPSAGSGVVANWSVEEQPAEEGVEERPSKRIHLEEDAEP